MNEITTETMQIESFVCDETAREHPEVSDEAKKLIEEMSLTGQKEMLTGPEGEETRVPFRAMTDEEDVVYSLLCPQQESMLTYSNSPIPYRVLEIGKLAQDTGYFEKIEVWDRKSAVIHDPVLIGYRKDGSYSWTKFILARWGQELEAFSVLKEKATAIVKERKIAKLTKILTEVKGEIESVKAGDFKFETSTPTFYS
jgi:hypothetical protein